jgi:hypothetical protein
MSWETRPRSVNRYYYRATKVGGRVRKEYLGAGPVAELAALSDMRAREQAAAQQAAWRTEVAQLTALRAEIDAVEELASLSMAAVLLLGGYHRHDRGAWRKRRG